MEKICVLGLGYIGLPMASLLAAKGFIVHGVDVNATVVETINQGNSHINEPGLNDLVRSAVQSGNLIASFKPVQADIFIIAVPTLIKKGHLPDISHIKAATQAIAPHLTPGNLAILESTSPVGTTEKVAGWIKKLRPDLVISSLKSHDQSTSPNKERGHNSGSGTGTHHQRKGDTLPSVERGHSSCGGMSPTYECPQFENVTNLRMSPTNEQIFLAHCPERVLPGRILKELSDNNRIIGGIDKTSALKAHMFYQKFVRGSISLTDVRTAELTKLVENSFRDVNIAFANELSLICKKLDINVWEVVELANRHPRVNILQPGPGVGGYCITRDPWFIVNSAPDKAGLICTARVINDNMPDYIVHQIKEMATRFKQPVITCLGLSYKADCGELRQSPAVKIVQQLGKDNTGQILAVEPYIKTLPDELINRSNIKLVDLKTGMEQADLVVLLVDHRAFMNVDLEKYGKKAVLDTRGMWR